MCVLLYCALDLIDSRMYSQLIYITCLRGKADSIPGGSCAAAANGALDGFVLGAAVDMPRGIRINAVCPEVLEVSREKYDGLFRGHVHVSNEHVGLAYSKAVEGRLTGLVFIVD